FGQMALLGLVAMSAYGVGDEGMVRWSSYYKVRYTPQTGEIDTNNISHQQMVKVGQGGPAYVLPHLLNRDAGSAPLERALIIGAGSGNDVQGALASGVGFIDAVEIDRLISQIGMADHPDRPFEIGRAH